MMFYGVVQLTQQNNMEKALKDLNQAYRWLARLSQVFNLDRVNTIYVLSAEFLSWPEIRRHIDSVLPPFKFKTLPPVNFSLSVASKQIQFSG